MSFATKSAKPPSVLGDNNIRTSRVTTIYQTQTVGSYTSWKQPVRAATTSNIVLAGLQTVDGVVLVNGDRILVKNQTDATENGIYIVQSTVNSVYNWQRSEDLPPLSDAACVAIFVIEGTVGGGNMYLCTDVTGLDTTSINDLHFEVFSSGGGGGGGGGGSPGGSEYDVQFNLGGSEGEFGGSSLFQFNPETQEPTDILPVYVKGKLIIGEPDVTQRNSASVISGADATPDKNAGTSVWITGGGSSETSLQSYGGDIVLTGGYSATESGGDAILSGGYSDDRGGNASIYGGKGLNGGKVTIEGGLGTDSRGGNVIINGGKSTDSTGGNVEITSGSSTNGYPGQILIRGGDNGGNISIEAGPSPNTGGFASFGAGGNIDEESGPITEGGGDVQLYGGRGRYGGIALVKGGYGLLNGGYTNIEGGQGAEGVGGQVNINGGEGGLYGGSVRIRSTTGPQGDGDIAIIAPGTGSILMSTAGIYDAVFIKGGLHFNKTNPLIVANLGGPSTVTALSRQGTITVTDPTLLAGSSAIITVNCDKIVDGDTVIAGIKTFDTSSGGIPIVICESVGNTSFSVKIYNAGTTSIGSSEMSVSYMLM